MGVQRKQTHRVEAPCFRFDQAKCCIGLHRVLSLYPLDDRLCTRRDARSRHKANPGVTYVPNAPASIDIRGAAPLAMASACIRVRGSTRAK